MKSGNQSYKWSQQEVLSGLSRFFLLGIPFFIIILQEKYDDCRFIEFWNRLYIIDWSAD